MREYAAQKRQGENITTITNMPALTDTNHLRKNIFIQILSKELYSYQGIKCPVSMLRERTTTKKIFNGRAMRKKLERT